MRSRHIFDKGFTLVEILIVMAIFGVFMGAIYSLYITHYNTAFNREEVIDVQQNVRIAMNKLTNDIMMAGFLVPPTASGRFLPVASGLANYSTTITLRTASADESFIKLAASVDTTAASTLGPLTVKPLSSLNRFRGGDSVIIVRAMERTQPLTPVFTVLTSNRATGTLTINNNPIGSSFTAGTTLRGGDVICKVSSTAAGYPETVTYAIAPCDSINRCLTRSVNGGAATVVATNIQNISFSYLFDDGTESYDTATVNTEDMLSALRAVRVTVTGKTIQKTSNEDQQKTRQLTSVVKIRNKR